MSRTHVRTRPEEDRERLSKGRVGKDVSNKSKFSRFATGNASTSTPKRLKSKTTTASSTRPQSTRKETESTRKMRSSQSRLPFSELQKQEREMSHKNIVLQKEKRDLEAEMIQLSTLLSQKTEKIASYEETVKDYSQQESELLTAHSALSEKMNIYEKKMEDMGIDPVTLVRFPINHKLELEMASEIDEFNRDLRELNTKLSLSHDTLQNNITRMTSLLANLNNGANEFTDLLDENDGDSFMDESFAESLNESFEPLDLDASFQQQL